MIRYLKVIPLVLALAFATGCDVKISIDTTKGAKTENAKATENTKTEPTPPAAENKQEAAPAKPSLFDRAKGTFNQVVDDTGNQASKLKKDVEDAQLLKDIEDASKAVGDDAKAKLNVLIDKLLARYKDCEAEIEALKKSGAKDLNRGLNFIAKGPDEQKTPLPKQAVRFAVKGIPVVGKAVPYLDACALYEKALTLPENSPERLKMEHEARRQCLKACLMATLDIATLGNGGAIDVAAENVEKVIKLMEYVQTMNKVPGLQGVGPLDSLLDAGLAITEVNQAMHLMLTWKVVDLKKMAGEE
jgi:hypothetical protein